MARIETEPKPLVAEELKGLMPQASNLDARMYRFDWGNAPEVGMKLDHRTGWYKPSAEEIKKDAQNKIEAEHWAKEQEQMKIKSLQNDSKIPLRLRKSMDTALATPDDHGWMQKLKLICSKADKGFLFALVGSYGVGKSQLGAAVCWKVAESKLDSRFINSLELFDTIKDLYRADRGETVENLLRTYTLPKLLVIDEVNKGMSEHDIRYLHRIVCQRYDAMKDTLLISNESKSDFQQLVGDRIVSRMIEVGGIIEFNWQSFRKQQR